jgi:hypothetical protein
VVAKYGGVFPALATYKIGNRPPRCSYFSLIEFSKVVEQISPLVFHPNSNKEIIKAINKTLFWLTLRL